MKVEIYGNTVASACAALKAQSLGHEVTWFTKNDSQIKNMRPTRLSQSHISQILEYTRPFFRALPSLIKAQAISNYSTLNSKALSDPWKSINSEKNYWVDEKQLIKELKEAAANSSMRILHSDLFPRFMGNTANMSIVDAFDTDLALWSQRLFNQPHHQEDPSHCLQLHIAKNPRQQLGHGKILKLRDCLGFIEPSGPSSSVISFFSDKKQNITELRSVLGRQMGQNSGIPIELGVLITLNPGATQRSIKTFVGQAQVIAPGLFPIGHSIGTLNPENNQQTMMSLDHLVELESILTNFSAKNQVKVYQLSERWIESKRNAFRRRLYLTKLWKKALLSPQNQRLVLSTHSILPPFLRQSLASPL
ncbi:hypothetical protein GW915_02690 [bacterium]|nr:hypothetical protein [bacterium]